MNKKTTDNIINDYVDFIKNNESIFPMDSPHMVRKKPDEDKKDDLLDTKDIEDILKELDISP